MAPPSWFTPLSADPAPVADPAGPVADDPAPPGPDLTAQPGLAPGDGPAADRAPAADLPPGAPVTAATLSRRRWVAALATAVVAAVAAWCCVPVGGQTRTLTDGSGQVDTVLDVSMVAAADASDAVVWLGQHPSFDGFTPRPGGTVRWAHVGSTAVFSRTDLTTCVYYAVVDRQATAVAVDGSGQACTDRAVEQVRESLLAQQGAARAAAAAAADADLVAAATSALHWAGSTVDASGTPTVTGMPPVRGVVVTPFPGGAVLTRTVGEVCRTLTVMLPSDPGTPGSCP